MEKNIKEVTEDIKKNIGDRLNHPFWLSFTLFWLLLNWKAVIAFLVVPPDGQNKIGFIESQFFTFGVKHEPGIFELTDKLLVILMITGLVYAYYWFIKPTIIDPVSKKVNEKELIKVKVSEKKEKLINENREKWINEYHNFISLGYKRILDQLINIIYSSNGSYVTEVNFERDKRRFISPKDLAFVNSNGLISIDKESRKLDFTEKGLFFVKEIQNKDINL